jgi:hypothetical protein
MDWKEALTALAHIAPKLAFKPDLIAQLKAHTTQSAPPAVLMAQMEVMLSVAKQNQRIAELHGYPSLEEYAKRVEAAIQNVLSALKSTGVAPVKNQQAGAI